MGTNFTARYVELAKRHSAEPLAASDGWPEEEFAEVEARLGFPLPSALRAYYARMGRNSEVSHNELMPPKDLDVCDDYLIFMHENQNVVSWGIRTENVADDDPEVWQRNNTPPIAWFSEEMTFSAFIQSMLEFLFPRDV